MKLSQYLEELIKPNVYVVYAGRFQPLSKHHFQIYYYLANKFGKDNVYITMAEAKKSKRKIDSVVNLRNPFTFEERKHMWSLMGIPEPKIQQIVGSTYNLDDIQKTLGINQDTSVIFAVGEKDNYLIKNDHYEEYKEQKDLKTLADGIAYYYTIPSIKEDNELANSTSVRDAIQNQDWESIENKIEPKILNYIKGLSNERY